jgi:hypothetical protein
LNVKITNSRGRVKTEEKKTEWIWWFFFYSNIIKTFYLCNHNDFFK